jgi:cytochrome c553
MYILRAAIVLIAFAWVVGAQAAGDATAGKEKAGVCAGCHGADGNSANPEWPKLAGQHAGYVAKQLADYKSKKRENPIMAGQAAALSEADMADLGAYFAKQTTSAGAADKDKLALGEKIYRGGNSSSGVAACIGCHGPTGTGNPMAKFPSLSYQHAAYVEKTLKDFRAGARANDAGQMMRNIAAKMTDAEIAAVASYIQGLH